MSPEVTVREDAVEPEIPSEEYFAFPLTPGQKAMLPVNLDSTGDPRFNGAFRMNLIGPINSDLLERSLRQIAERHEVLRTVFQSSDSGIVQIVQPHSSLELQVVSLKTLQDEQQTLEVDSICLREAQTGFNLAQRPPYRFLLLELNENRSMLVLTLHQAISDGWSIGILMEELSKIYTALATSQTASLPPLEFQFGDYVIWQQELMAQPEVLNQLSYWKKQLANSSDIQLAPDFTPAEISIRSDIVTELLPAELSTKIRGLAQDQQTTFFVVSMSICMALLHRYTGLSDIALRSPLAGRTRIEFESLIGQFVNQVVIRSDVYGSSTFTQLVANVRERVWEALSNQDVPFEAVLEALTDLPVEPANSFRVNFVCQKEYGRSGPSKFDLNGTQLTTMPSKSQGALYDINFFLVEREIGWRLSIEYKTDIYSQETAQSLLRHFIEFAEQVADNPVQRIMDVLLTSTEALKKRMQSPPTFSDTATGNEPAKLIAIPASFAQARFWTLSAVDPENPAFHMPVTLRLDGSVSVALLEKSFKILIDRHEILRTSFSEIDGQLMQVIHEDLPFRLDVVAIEAESEHEKNSSLNLAIKTFMERPFDLSVLPLFRVILFRLSEQEQILALCVHHVIADAWSIQVFQRELWTAYEELRTNAAFSFEPLSLQYGDFSVWQRETAESEATQEHLQYWLNLLSGDLPVLNFPTDRPPHQLAAPKSALETLLLPEDLTQSLKLLAQANNTTLYVVTLACFSIMLAKGSNANDMIVGSPVVNRRLETEPLIGPFAGPVALRLKPSKDATLREVLLATKELTLEALGHTEIPFEVLLDQLNVRPANGRSPIFQYYFFCQPAFLQARELGELTVTPLPTTSIGLPFEMQLAVIERKEGVRAQLEFNANLFDASTIKAWLNYYQKLLIAITSNLDLRLGELLPPPYQYLHEGRERIVESVASLESEAQTIPAEANSPFVRDAISDELTSLWQSALEIKDIGPHDNFFVLGGRSLAAARLIAQINKQYSLKLGLATFFNCPTIAQLSELVRGQLTPQLPSSIVTVQKGGPSSPLFMIHGVGGNVLNFYDLARSLGHNQTVYGIEAQSLQPDAAPLTSLEELAAYYVREVRKVQPHGPYNFLGYSYGGFVAFEMARQLQLENEEVTLLGMLDTPVWRHVLREEKQTIRTAVRQLMAVWSPFAHRLRPLTPMEIFDAVKSTVLRTFYTFATARGMVIPPKLRSVYHINSFAAVNYVPKPYNGFVTILRASREKGPRDLGWGKFTTQPARIFEIPGAHLQVLSNENLPRVVKSLQECLPGI